MGVERPMLGFLGESGEKTVAFFVGTAIGFSSGGIAGAATTAFGFSTYVGYRWLEFNMKNAERKTNEFLLKFCSTGFFALLSGVGVNFLHYEKKDVCGLDKEAFSCKLFSGLEITCLIGCLVLSSTAIYIWQSRKEEKKSSWFS